MKVKIFKLRLDELYLGEDEAFLNDFLESVKVNSLTPSLISRATETFWSIFISYEELDEQTVISEKILYDASEALTPEEDELFVKLRTWRGMKARKEGIPPYMILNTSHLKTIIKLQPQRLEDFTKIKGLAKSKIDKYGQEVLELLGQERKSVRK